jgi:flagellar basal body P-ring formation protein FlgA
MKKISLTILTIALGLSSQVRAEPEFQSHESIYQAVKDYITEHSTSTDYETSIAALDSQLKLPLCPESLQVTTSNDQIKAGRNSVGVRCNSASKWSLYVSAIIKTFHPVVVLKQPLQRGETITRQHLALERKDVSGLRGDFISDIAEIENKQIVKSTPADTILSPRNIAEPKLVKRGDKITISFLRPEFGIRMNGLALMDGTKGQLIRIKNQSSGRIITATVIEAGLVTVNR